MKLIEENINLPINDSGNEAYSALYKRYFKQLLLFAYKYVYDVHCAEDLVHDVFISIWENKQNFELHDQKQLEHYLYRAVKNNCTTYLKRESKQRNHRDRILAELLDRNNDYHDHVVDQELSDKIHEVIKDLPETTRKIFKLSRLDGLRNREIADKLKMTEKNIEYHLSKTIKLFKIKLVKYVTLLVAMLTFFTL